MAERHGAAVRIGVVVPELMGHMNPAIELARELGHLGHQAILVTRPPGHERASKLWVGHALYATEAPGRAELGKESGLAALRALATYLRAANAQLLGGALDLLCGELELDALVIDETLQGACLVAARRGMPYATFCAALSMSYDPAIPPPIFAWQPASGWAGKLRDRLGWNYFAWVFRHVWSDLERYREAHGIPLHDADGNSVYVGRAQVAQQPFWLDFPRAWEAPFLATGAWVTRDQEEVPFPWFWLEPERGLVYVCMGTIAHDQAAVSTICNAVQAAAKTGAQVVVSTGGNGLADGALVSVRELYAAVRLKLFGEDGYGAKDVLVVPWAPHYALIARADVVVTNAGLNTTLACIQAAKHTVGYPLSFDQPGIAARILFASSGATR